MNTRKLPIKSLAGPWNADGNLLCGTADSEVATGMATGDEATGVAAGTAAMEVALATAVGKTGFAATAALAAGFTAGTVELPRAEAVVDEAFGFEPFADEVGFGAFTLIAGSTASSATSAFEQPPTAKTTGSIATNNSKRFTVTAPEDGAE